MAKIPTGRFVWFDYVAKDAAKAQAFFGELFHWKTKPMAIPGGGSYTMITLDDQPIGGYMSTSEGAPPAPHWLSHLQVEDAAATVAQIRALGGKVRQEPRHAAGVGTLAIVADPGGATFALWQPDGFEAPADYTGRDGAWVWNELMTDDPEGAIAFYKQVGGFDEKPMASDRMDTYHLLERDGKGRAGIMKKMHAQQPTAWLPYVKVANTDQSVEKAKRLGANIMVPGTDIPNVGRFSVLTDPLGGAIAILQPMPG